LKQAPVIRRVAADANAVYVAWGPADRNGPGVGDTIFRAVRKHCDCRRLGLQITGIPDESGHLAVEIDSPIGGESDDIHDGAPAKVDRHDTNEQRRREVMQRRGRVLFVAVTRALFISSLGGLDAAVLLEQPHCLVNRPEGARTDA
jgi:hypothetical protein